MSLFFFWLTSTIFVMKCGCFLELPERSASSQSTELRFQKNQETPCWPFTRSRGATPQASSVGSALKALDSQTSNLLTSIGETSPPTQRTIADAEAFVCQLYHKGTREVEINRERAAAFRTVKKNIDSLPPTQDALHLHIRRANYQSMIWKRAQEACPSIPRPKDENGWYLNDEGILKPKLMTQEVVSSACIQLAFCGCSSEQSCLNRRCTCVRLSLPCSRACKCCDTNRCRNPESR